MSLLGVGIIHQNHQIDLLAVSGVGNAEESLGEVTAFQAPN
jgi:hypothetical protein